MGDIILSKDIYEEIRIKDHTGKVLSEFSFNPSDSNIVERYEAFTNGLDELKEIIDEYETMSDSASTFDRASEQLKKINAAIYEKVDILLNTNAAESIFNVMGPLSPLPSGDYYFTFILEQIAKKIENATGSRMKKIDMKIKKHTQKYQNR